MKEILGAPMVQLIDCVNGTAAQSQYVDTKGAAHATIVVKRGTNASTNAGAMTIALAQSDDTVASNFATYVANQSISTSTAAGYAVRYEVDLKARKRYQRVTVTPGTHTTFDVIAVNADAILFRQAVTPSASSSLCSGTVVLVTGQGTVSN